MERKALEWKGAAFRAVHALRQVKIEDQIGYDVPPQAIPLLTQLKHQLLHQFQAVLKAGDPALTAATIHQRMLRRLQRAGIRIGDDSPTGYGSISKLEVHQPPGHPELLVFLSDVSIACGEDSSLYVFERQKDEWRMVIVIETNGYTQVKDALGDLHYGISPANTQGRWFLVYEHDYPWCTSAWNGIEYWVVRPGKSADHPSVVVTGTEQMYFYDDTLPRLRVGRDGFHLDFNAGYMSDKGPLTWTGVVRYRIEDNRAIRISPLASSPEGFLAEWRNIPWPDAARWSKAGLRATQRWHQMLRSPTLYPEFKFVQPCPDKNRWQIGLSLDPVKEGSSEKSQPMFVTLIKTAQSYSLVQIGPARPPGCPGEAQP